jgi:hypothetical protein
MSPKFMLYYRIITEHFLQQNAGLAISWTIWDMSCHLLHSGAWDLLPSSPISQCWMLLQASVAVAAPIEVQHHHTVAVAAPIEVQYHHTNSCCGCTYRAAVPSYSCSTNIQTLYSHFLHFCQILISYRCSVKHQSEHRRNEVFLNCFPAD